MNHFTFQSNFSFTEDDLFNYHARAGALERLIPPWEDIRVVSRTHPTLENDSEVTLSVPIAPLIRVEWLAKHIDVTPPKGFIDLQLSGPFAYWKHHHKIEGAAGNNSILTDDIEYKLPLHLFSKFLTPKIVTPKLHRTFTFRHRRTANDLTQSLKFRERKIQKILITGASGLVGRELSAFLQVSGYEIYTLSRSKKDSPNSFVWDIEKGVFPIEALETVDAVIHLSGEGIANKLWSERQKEKIMNSRVLGTRLLYESLAKTTNKPKVVISASAIGYYGECGEEELTEESSPGEEIFLSKVVKPWEEESRKIEKLGIRTVIPRIGIVLSPKGGALKKMLPAFMAGVAGKLGNGKQWMSWIDIDDLIYAFHTVLEDDSYHGSVNFTAPNPLRNSDFTKTLGKVINRPTLIPAPAFAIKAALGDMGKELLLRGAKVIPAKLQKNGFTFSFPSLESSLEHQLGRSK